MELIEADLNMTKIMFSILEQAASIDGVHSVTIQFSANGSDTIVIGYGEQAEPAILKVIPENA